MGGGGSFPTPAPTVRTLTVAPNGAWNHANDPHAIYLAGYVYAGYVDGTNGNVELAAYHIATDTTTTLILKAALDANTHVAPALLIRDSDHKLLVVYSQHSGANIWRRISTNSLDSDPTISGGFDAETNLDSSLGGTQYTYPTLLQLLGEANDPIWLFYRDRQSGGTSGTLCYSKSTDGGSTWTAQTDLFENGTKSPYWKVISDGNTRIDICTTDGRNPPDVTTTKMYHFYYDGTWRKSDGTALGSPQFAPASLTEVYNGADGTGWPMDIVGNSGNPIVAYAVVTGASDNDWRYAKWTGATWDKHTIAASNGVIEGSFAASVCLDHADPSYAYAPVKVGSHWEIKRFLTSDGGVTFTNVNITSGSSVDNLQPVSVRDHSPDVVVLWQYGTYTDYTNTNLGIKGASA